MLDLNNLTNQESNHKPQRILITGGASGIGATIAKRFISSGAKVAVVDKSKEAIVAADITLLGDVSEPASMDEVFSVLDQRWGGVDVVINNAGISIPASLAETTLEIWNNVISVNLTGVFLVSQRAATRMMNQGRGVIINISSVSGMVGMPNYLSYNISKAGVIELTKTLALELAPAIRVNAICPGYISTPMQEAEYTQEELYNLTKKIPARRLGHPSEIACLAFYLASDEARFITGSSIVIDGGETAGGLASL